MLATELLQEIRENEWGEKGDSPTETLREREEWYITSGVTWQAYEVKPRLVRLANFSGLLLSLL